MRFYPLSVLSIIAIGPLRGLATFAPRWDDVKAKHTWDSVPENWQNLGHPPSGTTIDFHIALKAQNENALTDVLYQVSSPDHPKEEVAELVAPPSDVLELANAWLEHHGIPPSAISTKHGGSWLTVIGVPVSRANELLSASYQLYRHIETNDTVVRTLSYGLPTALLEHVQNVAPTTHFGFPRMPRMRHDEAAGAQKRVPAGEPGMVLSSRQEPYVTPSFLRSLYKTSSYVPVAGDRNALGVIGFLDDYPNPDDLKQFMNEYRFDATLGNLHCRADQRRRYTSAMAFPTRRIFYSTGSADSGDAFINWLDYALDLLRVPQTVSTPYSVPEYTVPLDYATHLCDLYARLGARGASVLFSSGNNGVGRGNCWPPDSSGNSRVQFRPTFPSLVLFFSLPACSTSLTTPATVFAGPWVTSVGGTTGNNPELRQVSQAAVSRRIFRGRTTRTVLCPPSSSASAAGIAAFTSNELRYHLQNEVYEFGWHKLCDAGRRLAFLNPLLYGIGLEGLNDITSGSNPGCNTNGFSAVPGWDP
ncbi:subtilisin-like protein, partial [Lactarius hengduanensis]